MSNYITLLGAEDVSRAASRMESAAEKMQRAATAFDNTADRLIRAFESLERTIIDHGIGSKPPAQNTAPPSPLAEQAGTAVKPPKHKFWGAGEANCPADLKAPNGELHSLRCKVCGETNPRDQYCWASTPPSESAEKQAGPVAGLVAAYTEGHCAEKRKPGGCTLHNLHCGYPACDRKAAPPSPLSEKDKEDAADFHWLIENRYKYVWHHVLHDEEKAGHESIYSAIRAARAKKGS